MALGSEDAVDGTRAGLDDRRRGQARDLVSVVGGVHHKVLTTDALEVEVAEGVLDRGVRLQAHFLA